MCQYDMITLSADYFYLSNDALCANMITSIYRIMHYVPVYLLRFIRLCTEMANWCVGWMIRVFVLSLSLVNKDYKV